MDRIISDELDGYRNCFFIKNLVTVYFLQYLLLDPEPIGPKNIKINV